MNGFIVGKIRYKKAYLELVCGSGIGKKLINKLVRYFKVNGYPEIGLTAINKDLVKYYQTFGFEYIRKSKGHYYMEATFKKSCAKQ